MSDENYGFIYFWENEHPDAIFHKKYIGQHIGNISDGYIGSGVIFLKVFYCKKYRGFWKRKILECCSNQEALDEAECKWIIYYDAIKSDEFCNLREGGNGGKLHPDSIKKMKASLKGRIAWNKGTKQPPLTINTIQNRNNTFKAHFNIIRKDRETYILDHLKTNISIKIKELMKLWDCSLTPATKAINALLSEGLIKKFYFSTNDVRYVMPTFSIENDVIEFIRKNDNITIDIIIKHFYDTYKITANFVKSICGDLVKRQIIVNRRGYRKNYYSINLLR
jgi:predicted transcriptional regulator